MDLSSIAKDIRNSLRGKYRSKIQGSRLFMQCPFHAGDNDPSLCLTLDYTSNRFGSYFCFGCGAHGSWPKLAGTLGGSVPNYSFASWKDALRLLPIAPLAPAEQEHTSVESYLAQHCPVYTNWDVCNLDWRGFSAKDMCFLQARAIFDYNPLIQDRELMALFPVVVNGVVRGAVRCGYDTKLYLNVSGDWRNTYGLLFYDLAKKWIRYYETPFAVICEGVRDAARLVAAGVPAVANLGTQGFGRDKVNLLQVMCNNDTEVSRFYIATDPDVPGVEAANAINKELRSVGIRDVVDIDLPDDYVDSEGNPVKADIFELDSPDFISLVRKLRSRNGYFGPKRKINRLLR